MSKISKKNILFLAVTHSPQTKDRAYSDFVLKQCKTALSNDTEIDSRYNVDNFKRHDMHNSSSLERNIFHLIEQVDYHIVLIDCFNGSFCPNVWFELGIIAITSQKPMILIAQEKMHREFPFYIRNQVNVLQFPKLKIIKQGNRFVVDENSLNHSAIDQFKINFVKQFKACDHSPFEMFSDTFHLELSGYRNLRKLEEKLEEIVSNTQMAEYIDGEENAFNALQEAVSTAKFSLRTTRFANESIIHSGINTRIDDSVINAHDRFMRAIYDASIRIAENRDKQKHSDVVYRCDRIICNNSPQKWKDIYSALYHGSNIMKVYVRKASYSINFELVIVDEKIAFIHFYQTNRSEHNNSDIQKIKSTLKISDAGVCKELSKVFDRLHHRDFDGECQDLSRTLLGVERDIYKPGKTSEYGYFTTNNCPSNTSARDYIRDLFLNALMNWKFPSDNEDRLIMAAGYIKVNRLSENDFFDTESFFNKVGFSEEEKQIIRDKLIALGDN